MTNIKKYNNAFITVFDASEDELNSDFSRDKVEKWTSLAHMSLVGEVEDAFEIMMETEEILDFDSYNKGIEILKSHNISVGE